MSVARHLVAVWNPSYEADAMDAHVSLLLRHARASREQLIGVGCKGWLLDLAAVRIS